MATSRISLVLPLVTALGCSSLSAPPAARAEAKRGVPFVLDKTRASFGGTVQEVIDAGGYTYARVDDRWVVTLGKQLRVGQRVSVKGFGEKRSFHSARLSRTFDHLVFAVVKEEAT